jgi:hypothetical protein
LVLDVGPEGGRFEQTYQVWAETEAFLPGGPGVWPEEVQVDGGRVPVTSRDGVPQVRLEPGEHKIQGRFTWAEMPEMIQAPPRSALIQLTLAGRPVEFPVVDAEGRLWLQKRVEAAGEEDRLEVRLFRFIDDQIPMRVTNLVKLDVSGRVREVTLDGLLLPGSRPLSLDSPLPARLEEQGLLKVQVRPGRWDIRIGTRFEGPVNQIGPAPAPFGPETWAFKAANELRMVRVTGASSVDPGQTELPDGWKEFPAYIVAPGETLAFEEIRRGDPDPAPDRIHLERDWWLDFNGAGYTLRDRITGAMSRQWYLAMNPPAVLGRVSVSGEDQLITKHGPENKPGVELRLGRLNLAAESRFEAGIAQAPAVGWDHDFESVAARLHLPPGWRLLTASGVDVLPGTWFERWTLLDLFLVLIISLAVFKLTSWKWGLLALVTVGLCYHEPAAPRGVYIALLISLGLLRVLPPG